MGSIWWYDYLGKRISITMNCRKLGTRPPLQLRGLNAAADLVEFDLLP